ncbi:MAG: NAD/NADP octopine/nopaline dehydrogenase family protein [Firmicutes bacterium]|nr:NAD/NADP octopine/nopaline dehydrogenase family protein [Bacillota bacterium]
MTVVRPRFHSVAVRFHQHPRFAVLGAGHGGHALAGYLGLMGYPVRLYTHTPAKAEAVARAGGIRLEGAVEGFGPVEVSLDLAEVLSNADVILETHPAHLHRAVAQACAPWLHDGQVVVLNPGRTGGALEFSRTLQEQGAAPVLVAESQTFLFASRMLEPGRARIFGVKKSVPLAALPALHTPRVLGLLHHALPQFVPAVSVLETSLANMGSIFHPALTLLNAGRIEDTGGDYEFYHGGATPGVGRVLERLDAERLAVAAALDVQVPSARQWLQEVYGASGDNLQGAIQNNRAYAGIRAPGSLDHRYLEEDIPASLVPLASLGRHVGVQTLAMDSLIDLASVIHGTDYRASGRTVAKLGLDGLSPEQIRRLVMEGRTENEAIS